MGLVLSDWSQQRLTLALGDLVPPQAQLIGGVLCMLGQPLGVGQGNNPTCQSARALSMRAYNDPDYLLQMVTWAARDDEIIMHFEGQPISSSESVGGVASSLPMDLDPVSLLVVPHLDRIYAEMGRRCMDREGDPHRWVNPEFHGWWSGRGFRINVDVETGKLWELEDFLRHFYAAYHPYYNGNQPLIHPQPAGIAVTDSAARFIGWHAISILRVALDPQEVMRVYFYNPNNDSGQDWGDGVVVSTAGHGERFGEASLPFEQFASRLYIFHFDPLEQGELAQVGQQQLDEVSGYLQRSWGRIACRKADCRPAAARRGRFDLGLIADAARPLSWQALYSRTSWFHGRPVVPTCHHYLVDLSHCSHRWGLVCGYRFVCGVGDGGCGCTVKPDAGLFSWSW